MAVGGMSINCFNCFNSVFPCSQGIDEALMAVGFASLLRQLEFHLRTYKSSCVCCILNLKVSLHSSNLLTIGKRTTSQMINPSNSVSASELLEQEQEAFAAFTQDPNCISIREYYAYKFQIRENDDSCLLRFGRLFQQFSVDMFVKMETQRLDYFRTQQEDIRSDFLQGLADAMASGEKECAQIGQRTILPAGFVGGPRHMKRKYLDAMTLVRKFGKPDLFITITSNPNWAEIKECMMNGEEAHNRPDLVVRVFHAKLEELKNELFKKNIFGEVAAYTHVIEFQKRGLPHAHLLIILKPRFKIFKPEEFDSIVSAELPDIEKHPHLYRLVVKHMLHGPCGVLNPNNVCMKKNGKCRSLYPKEFYVETIITSDAYPTYRRRDDGKKTKEWTWIAGKTTLIPALDRVVYTICSCCHKSLRADTDWEFTCTNCHEKTVVKLRCHLELFISDGSAVLEAEMYSPYAEQLMGITAEDIHKAQINGTPIETDIEKAVENKQVVCFIKFFDKEFRGVTKRKFVVVKMFPAVEVFGDVKDINAVMLDAEAIRKPEGLAAEKQFFSPTTKLIIEEMLEEKKNDKEEVGQISGVKRSLQFVETSSQANVAAGVPLISEDAGGMQMDSTTSLVAASPGKKNKPKMKQS